VGTDGQREDKGERAGRAVRRPDRLGAIPGRGSGPIVVAQRRPTGCTVEADRRRPRNRTG
jgi:hypothetical protein